MKDTFLGFESFGDFFSSVFGAKFYKIGIMGLGLGAFISEFMNWADITEASMIVFIVVLSFKYLSGLRKYWKLRKFSVSKSFRIGITGTVQLGVILCATLMEKVSPIYEWIHLASGVYGWFIGYNFATAIRNFIIAGDINRRFYNWLKSYTEIEKYFKIEDNSIK